MQATNGSAKSLRVLVVGGSGVVGSRVVDHLLRAGHRVHALVRKGTDLGRLKAAQITITEGDLLDPPSLNEAVRGVDAIVTTAQGYARRPTDSLETVDDQGNRNLIDAAKEADVARFVFTSILKCDLAVDVPHFYQKKRIEDYLAAQSVPFVSLRPGAFLGGSPWMREPLSRGELPGVGPENVPWTYIHPDDVARSLAAAVDHPMVVGQKIDLGTDRAVSRSELARLFTGLSGHEFRLPAAAARPARANLTPRQLRDFAAMTQFFATGQYVADTTLQARYFPPVPTIEGTVVKVLDEVGLAPPAAR